MRDCKYETRMWANAQRDGCPAQCRWFPLFNTANFGWHPLLKCHAITWPRHEIRWNLLWCPKLTNRSQRLVGWSSPYCEDIWGRHCCLTIFFSDCRYVPFLQRYNLTKLYDGAQMANFKTIFWVLHLQQAASSAFDIQSATAEIRRGKKKKEKKETGQN